MISSLALWAKGTPRSSVPDNVALLRATVEARKTQIESKLSGSSMGGAIPDGAPIRISALDADSFAPGRVVVCANRTSLIAHRIVRLGRRGTASGYVVTLGDGNWLCDAPTAKSAIIGEVREFCVNGEWRPVPASAPGPARAFTGSASWLLYAAALEISPHFALLIGLTMTYARIAPGVIWRRLKRTPHVRP